MTSTRSCIDRNIAGTLRFDLNRDLMMFFFPFHVHGLHPWLLASPIFDSRLIPSGSEDVLFSFSTSMDCIHGYARLIPSGSLLFMLVLIAIFRSILLEILIVSRGFIRYLINPDISLKPFRDSK